jgi:hypothetical protein
MSGPDDLRDPLVAGGPEADPQGVAAARIEGRGPSSIGEAERRTLAALADQLIPAGQDMPAASEAGVTGRGLDELLASRPDLVDDLRRVLHRAAGEEPARFVGRLMVDPDATDFAVLATVVPGAYYLDARIRARIGYPGQQAIAIPDPSLDAEDEELLRGVVERGTIFRT